MKRTPAQILLGVHLSELGYMCVPEHRFLDDRQFRFDWADLEHRIGYECDGGQWRGGHMRGLAVENQYEKDRLAQLHGWRIFRFTNRQILNGQAKNWLINNVGRQQ
jgi:very-short-patch-repair endonuclease